MSGYLYLNKLHQQDFRRLSSYIKLRRSRVNVLGTRQLTLKCGVICRVGPRLQTRPLSIIRHQVKRGDNKEDRGTPIEEEKNFRIIWLQQGKVFLCKKKREVDRPLSDTYMDNKAKNENKIRKWKSGNKSLVCEIQRMSTGS